jgi:hypothetical protein
VLEQGDSGISANEPVAPKWRERTHATPLRAKKKESPSSRRRTISPLSFRSSRWVISRDRGEGTQ